MPGPVGVDFEWPVGPAADGPARAAVVDVVDSSGTGSKANVVGVRVVVVVDDVDVVDEPATVEVVEIRGVVVVDVDDVVVVLVDSVTTSVPRLLTLSLSWNGQVPALVNWVVTDVPGWISTVVQSPLSAVAVWAVMSLFCQVTMSFLPMVTSLGL